MRNLVKAELFKLNKNKIFLILIIINLLSILYGAGIKYKFSFVNFSGDFDIFRYVFSIWQLYFILGIPMIILMYAGSKILGDEIAKGQILLEVAPVANRKKLLSAKFIAMIYSTLYFILTNIIINVIVYMIFVKGTEYYAETQIFRQENLEMLIQIIFGFLEIYLLTMIAMLFSIDYGAIIGTLFSMAFYIITSLLSRSTTIDKYVPGYFNFKGDCIINFEIVLIQLSLFAILIFVVLKLSLNKFNKKDI